MACQAGHTSPPRNGPTYAADLRSSPRNLRRRGPPHLRRCMHPGQRDTAMRAERPRSGRDGEHAWGTPAWPPIKGRRATPPLPGLILYSLVPAYPAYPAGAAVPWSNASGLLMTFFPPCLLAPFRLSSLSAGALRVLQPKSLSVKPEGKRAGRAAGSDLFQSATPPAAPNHPLPGSSQPHAASKAAWHSHSSRAEMPPPR